MYGEGGLKYGNYDWGGIFDIGIQGGIPIGKKFELGTAWSFINVSPDGGGGNSGISDITVSGRYNFMPSVTNISAGAYLTIPVGSKDVGQNNFNVGIFGALRHPLSEGVVITGVTGLDFLEMGDDRKTSLLLGGGAIFRIQQQFHVVTELNFWTEGDYALLSGGVDYKLNRGNKIRGALGLGLNDGAPDVAIMGSFLHFFR